MVFNCHLQSYWQLFISYNFLFQTDVYKSKRSRVCFGIYSSKEKAVDTAKEGNLYSHLSEVEVIECEIDWFEEIR